MNNENEKQVCTNCKYYKRHYILDDNGRFYGTCKGHCVHLKVNSLTAAKHVKRNEGCVLWQPYELQKLEVEYGVELRLERILREIADVLAVLRDAE